jgi:hypothetical protein
MQPQRLHLEQDHPSDHPVSMGTRSLLVAIGMITAVPIALWALDNPVYAAGLAVVVFVGVALARFVDRFRRGGHGTFHVPGTDFDIEVAVTRPSRSR